MSKKVTIPVRLSSEQLDAVQRLAAEHDTSEAQIVRWSIKALLAYVEHHDGRLTMPFDFTAGQSIARQIVEHDPAERPRLPVLNGAGSACPPPQG